MSKLSVLMTVYNEADFLDYAIRACLPHVDQLVIVEGAYKETINLGKPPTSDDGTIDIINKYVMDPKILYKHVNRDTDKDQRNAGLIEIKHDNPDGYLLIIDGDEVYTPENFQMIRATIKNMERSNKFGAYFKSLTFVNDLKHYTEQEFPRLFKITKGCEFVNDNFMVWKDVNKGWNLETVTKNPYIRFHHYAFCKNKDRFETKKKWWETRFGKPFDYGWHVNEEGQIEDPNHKILEYTGRHPKIMEEHPLWKASYDEETT